SDATATRSAAARLVVLRVCGRWNEEVGEHPKPRTQPRPRPLFQSAVTPAALIGPAHFSIWLSTNFCRYSGQRRSGATTSTPISLRRPATAGVVMVATAAS